jgi:hypothetical protein
MAAERTSLNISNPETARKFRVFRERGEHDNASALEALLSEVEE